MSACCTFYYQWSQQLPPVSSLWNLWMQWNKSDIGLRVWLWDRKQEHRTETQCSFQVFLVVVCSNQRALSRALFFTRAHEYWKYAGLLFHTDKAIITLFKMKKETFGSWYGRTKQISSDQCNVSMAIWQQSDFYFSVGLYRAGIRINRGWISTLNQPVCVWVCVSHAHQWWLPVTCAPLEKAATLRKWVSLVWKSQTETSAPCSLSDTCYIFCTDADIFGFL